MDVCFHYQSPRSGENFDTFMQENAQTCIKMNACFHIIRDIFMQEKALKYGCFVFMQENALKYGCLFSLPFVAWRRKLWHFYAGKCIKMNAFIINHRAAAKKMSTISKTNFDNFMPENAQNNALKWIKCFIKCLYSGKQVGKLTTATGSVSCY